MKNKTLLTFVMLFTITFVISYFAFYKISLMQIDQTYFVRGTTAHGLEFKEPDGTSMTYYDGAECEDPGYVYCGGNVCGVDQAWCENWRNGGKHCKANDPNWCCYDPGYVVCGNTETCGPSLIWCDNFLNGDKSCNYINGGNRCCNDAGYVYAYNFDVCCPPSAPYTPDGKWCYTTPQGGEDNFYTRHSKCSTPNQESCSSQSLKKCEATQPFIYDWKTYGFTKGKCGVECVANTDCVAPEVSNITFCKGKNIALNISSAMCTSLHACQPIYDTIVLGSCSISCMDRPTGAECSDPIVYKSIGVAVSVIILLGIGSYFYFRKKKRR